MRSLLVILALLGAGYFAYTKYIAPEWAARNKVEQMLGEASELARAGDAARLHALLDKHLAADARVLLEISYGVLGPESAAGRMRYDKAGFLQFMQGVLARTRQWEVQMAIADFKPNENSAEMRLTGRQMATVPEGAIPMRYLAMVECNTSARIADIALFSGTQCKIRLQGMPRGVGVIP
jgi:hypothetical protein